MSDFLFSARRNVSAELAGILGRYLNPVAPLVERCEGEWGSLAVVRAIHDDARTLVEDEHHISVVVGTPVVRVKHFAAGTTRGQQRRVHLHGLIRDRATQWDDHLDGQYAILIVDKLAGSVQLITDRFAFIPVFSARSASNDRVAGTHVDAVALAAGRHHDIDLVSVADVLETLTCTVPWTIYSGVTQQPPATVVTAESPARETSVTFWQPDESDAPRSMHQAAESLRAGIVDDIAATIQDADAAGILLSAGEDSRVLLAALEDRLPVKAVTFASWHSREARIAARIARAHNAEHVIGFRPPDHYTRGFHEVSSMMGSHHLFNDVHGFGFHESLGIDRMPVVIGGLSSDSLLKGTYTAKPPIPVKARGIDSLIRKDLLYEAKERRATYLRDLAAMRPRSAHEWRYLWPFAMRKHGGNVDGNRRICAIHETYHCNAVLDVAAAAPVEWKLRRRLFHEAVKPLLSRTRFVPHAEYRFPAFGAEVNLLMLPALAAARGIRALATRETGARQRSWPTWGSVVKSPEAEAIRERWPLGNSSLRELFGPQRADMIDTEVAQWYSLRRLALMQLVYLSYKSCS